MSASAISQAKQKILPSAFEELSRDLAVMAESDEENFLRWQGLRVLAGDGSTLQLGELQYCSIIDSLSEEEYRRLEGPGWKTYETDRKEILLVSIYDTLNRLTLHADYCLKNIGERELLSRQLKALPKGCVLVLDRGYHGAWLFHLLNKLGIRFCVRMPIDRGIKWQKEFIDSGKDELKRRFVVPKKDFEKLRMHGLKPRKGTGAEYRVIRVDLSGDEPIELLVTNLPKHKFKADLFGELYNLRWPIEGSYDILKNTLRVESWNARNAHGLELELQAKIFCANLTSLLTASQRKQFHSKLHRAEKAVQRPEKWQQNQLYKWSVNTTQCIAEICSSLPEILLKNWTRSDPVPDICAELKSELNSFNRDLIQELLRCRNWISLDVPTDNKRRFKHRKQGRPPGYNRKIS